MTILNEQLFEYLIEKRCLACYPYFDTINEIINYSKNFIQNTTSKNNSWKFEIPLSISQGICIFNELHIIIEVENIFNYSHKEDIGFSNSYVEPYSALQIKNGIFYKPEFINIYCYAENGKLYENTLYANLVHELNHKIEQLFRDMHKDKINGIDPIFMQAACYEILQDVQFSKNKFYNDYIHMITYRLFEDTELNALVSQVAPELLSMQSINKEDIKKTSTFLFYDFMNNHLDVLNKLTNAEWQTIYNKISNLTIWQKEMGLEDFKRSFKKKTMACLDKLKKKIDQAASLYFEGSLSRKLNENLKRGQIILH